jgi:peptidoglycan hydrolase-like protein with peptidoglycan-binding domain
MKCLSLQTPHFMNDREIEFPSGAVLKKGDRGGLVKRLQEWLCFHNCLTKIDRDFGSSTERQVNSFRKKMNLPENGKVDGALFSTLSAPMTRTLTDLTSGSKTVNALTLDYAKQHLKEHPLELGGDNCGTWVRLYSGGKDGSDWRWCAGFATFVVRQAALTCGVSMPVVRTLSCDTLALRAQERGRFVRGSRSRPRDIQGGDLFLVRRTSTDWIHTGIVSRLHQETFDTIEGNTNDEGSVNGYEVCARNRAYSSKIDFIQIS